MVLANGAPVETFCDHIGREAFDNHAEFAALYPDGREIEEMALPHAKSARQLPRATRARLEARALAGARSVRTAALTGARHAPVCRPGRRAAVRSARHARPAGMGTMPSWRARKDLACPAGLARAVQATAVSGSGILPGLAA